MYPRIFAKVLNEPWLLQPSAHHAMVEALVAHCQGKLADVRGDVRIPDVVKDEMGGGVRKIEHYRNINGVAHIEVAGVMGRKLDAFERWCGGCDVNWMMHGIERAVQDDSVHTVVLDIDSPGGAVTGAEEAARFIQRANAVKPVVGYTETMACSCAQWLLAACGSSYVGPSASVGSIGVYMYWLDTSRAHEAAGVDPVMFAAGKHKGIGLMGRGLSDDDVEMLQATVDGLHADFKAAVREMRGVDIADEWMEGQSLTGKFAASIGLVDGVVDTFDELLLAVR